MKEKYVNPFTDFGFKRIFGNEANKDLLIDFLNNLLAGTEVIKTLQFKNSERIGNIPVDRKAIFDLYCDIAELSNFNREEYNAYEGSLKSYRDLKNVIDTAMDEGIEKGIKKGIKKGIEKGIKEGIKKGIKEGMEKGRSEGRAEEKELVAKKLKELGMEINKISDATGLLISEIEIL